MTDANELPVLPDEGLRSPLDVRSLVGGAGTLLGKAVDPERPMGSWTGLPLPVGAPLSGALWGAGLGAAYHGLKPLLTGKDHKRKQTLLRSILAGAGIGGAVGLGAGTINHYKQNSAEDLEKRAAADLGLIVQTVMRDPTLTEFEKRQILAQLSSARDDTLRRIVTAASTGGITGAMVARLLGFRGMGTALAGLAGAGLVGNYFRGPQGFV